MSHLTDKSKVLSSAAALLHEKGLYPAVAHSAYYSCYQLMMHIWLHSMKKTAADLRKKCSVEHTGTHEILINEVGRYIKYNRKNFNDSRSFKEAIHQLKRLRVSADYDDEVFVGLQSQKSIALSSTIIPILKKY